MNKLLLSLLCFLSMSSKGQVSAYSIGSPDHQIVVTFIVDASTITYKIDYKGEKVLESSRLGLLREDEDFANALRVVSVSGREKVQDHYQLFTGKRKINNYQAN